MCLGSGGWKARSLLPPFFACFCFDMKVRSLVEYSKVGRYLGRYSSTDLFLELPAAIYVRNSVDILVTLSRETLMCSSWIGILEYVIESRDRRQAEATADPPML